MAKQQKAESSLENQGTKGSIRAWVRRMSTHINPLAVGMDTDQASIHTADDAVYVTATPNTPSSITFPESCRSPLPISGGHGRTPKTSVSNQSDQTAVDSGNQRLHEVERIDTIPGGDLPLPFHGIVIIPLLATTGGCTILLALASLLNQKHDGWGATLMVGLAEGTGYKHMLFTIPPILVSMLISAGWIWTDMAVRRLQPLLNLAHREAPEVPEKTLLLSYESTNVFVAFVRSLRRKDYLVALGTFLSILSLLLQPFAGALFTVRDVWWLGHEFSVNGLSKVGVNRAANFMDMTAFLAASSFASADVIYHIGPPPFVSGGYTVGEFEITDNDIGILYANRSAVLSQAVCSAPDSLAMVNEQNERSVWHNTALFGHCQYTWTVNSNATYLFGVATADFADCGQDYASVPIQYRPVLFWFFMYSPEPTASVVLCIPHASGLTVSVAINLATKSTDVTPLQSSPDDANSTDIGSFTYNGLFFDEASMDETSLARLQSIQQQLPGAVFEAAKANDTMLLSTFTSNGFTALAQDVYTTYLSLVAKSLYLIEDHSTLSVRVGSNCKRIFLVPSAVVILCIAMSALVILGSFLHMSHYHARRGLPIPSGLGTLSAAIWLTAQTDLALALADDEATPDKIEERLSGHRYFIHKQSGRILRLPDPESGRDTPLSASKGLSAWLLPLRRKSAGLVSQKNSNSSASDVEIANAV